MRHWLTARREGRICKPNPDEPTSVLRPSRSTTFAEKRVKENRRKAQAAAASSPILCQLLQLQEAAAVAEAAGKFSISKAAKFNGSANSLSVQTTNLEPAVADPGLATLVAQTMCELESSPAKPRQTNSMIGDEPSKCGPKPAGRSTAKLDFTEKFSKDTAKTTDALFPAGNKVLLAEQTAQTKAIDVANTKIGQQTRAPTESKGDPSPGSGNEGEGRRKSPPIR